MVPINRPPLLLASQFTPRSRRNQSLGPLRRQKKHRTSVRIIGPHENSFKKPGFSCGMGRKPNLLKSLACDQLIGCGQMD
jgi:hypothetical protein